jgi:predicted regulator of Ras-like GTPase activity (Roadblock/LC7/MglB family)
MNFGIGPRPDAAAPAAVRGQLTDLQLRVPGVRGCVLAGADGLLITHNLPPGPDPHDLSALAATTFGVARQCGLSLGQGAFRDSTVRSTGGYFTVYAIGERALLAVLGDDGLNVARLHIEARPATERLADLMPRR